MNRDDPGDEEVRAMLADTARARYEPRRQIVRAAMKRLRLRRHAVSYANESLSGFAKFARGLAALWSAEKDSDV